MTKNCEKDLDGVFLPSEISNLQEIVDGLKREGMDDLEARIEGAKQLLSFETQQQLEIDALVREAVGMPQYVQPPRPEVQAEQASDTAAPKGTPKPKSKAEKRGLPPALEAKMVKKTPGEMRAELVGYLGKATVKRLEELGVLILDRARRIKVDNQGNKRAVQGTYNVGEGTIRLYGGTQHVDRSTVGVMMHEGSHSGMNRILDGKLGDFVQDIITQAKAGNELALNALAMAARGSTDPLNPDVLFANTLQGYTLREEVVAYYVQNSVEQGTQSGIFRRLMNSMKAKFALTPFGKLARAVGVKVELTPEMAVEFAKEAVRDTVATVEVLNQLERAVKAKQGGSINSKKAPAKAQLDSATTIMDGIPGPGGENLSLRETGIRMEDGKPVVSINEDMILMRDNVNKEKARTLADVLEDSDLFAAYPELRNYPVSYSRLEGAPATRIHDTIFIDSRTTDPAAVRDAVLAQVDQIMADQDGWLGFEGEQTPSDYNTMGTIFRHADTPGLKREIKRMMTDPVAATITEGILESSTSKATPGADMGRLAQLLGPKLYGDKSQITSVSTKELFQNSFDAVRDYLAEGAIDQGRIDIRVDPEERSITVEDNGPGMTIDIINNAFLTIAGTHKPGEIKSGGLGIAKMLFLFGNERLELTTVRDGKMHTLRGTGESFMESFKNPELAPDIITTDTNEPPGTTVKVVIPETFVDTATGRQKDIDFPSGWDLNHAPDAITESPLFQDIEVTWNGRIQDVGGYFPNNDFVPFSTVNFEWGNADIIISKTDETQYGNNVIVLSNGLYQFGMKLKENPFKPGSKTIPKKIYIDIHSRVEPEEEGYPFDLNRQRFSPAVDEGMGQIMKYLSVLYGGSQAAETAAGFGNVEYVNDDGTSGDLLKLAPEAVEDDLKGKLQVDKTSKMEVKNGKLTLNGKVLPELTADDLAATRVDLAEFRIDQGDVDANRPMIHNNMVAKVHPVYEELAEAKKTYDASIVSNGILRDVWKAEQEDFDKWKDIYDTDGEAMDDPEFLPRQRKVDEAYNAYMENNKKSDAAYEKLKDLKDQAVDVEPETIPLLQHLRSKFGEKRLNQYLGGIGRGFMAVRDAVHQLDPEHYDGLEKVTVGTSFDQEYYGVHVWVPFEGMFINPGIALFSDPERAGMAMYMTMVHEIAHYVYKGHGGSFATELQRLTVLLEAGGIDTARLKNRMSNTVEYNHDIFTYIQEAMKNGTVENTGKRLAEPDYDKRSTGYTIDLAGTGYGTGGGGPMAGELASSLDDMRGGPRRTDSSARDGDPRTLDELESAYSETVAAAGNIISPRLLESIGLPDPSGISHEAPMLDLNEGNLLGQVVADPAYVGRRIALAVGPELESAADEYTRASAETKRQMDDLLRAASEQVGHTVSSVTEAMSVLGEERFENFLAGEAELERLANDLLGAEALAEAQAIFERTDRQVQAREAYLKEFPLSNFTSVQQVIDTLDEAGIPEDTYMHDMDKLTLVEGVPVILEALPSEMPGGITVAFRSLQDRILHRDGYERQMFFRNSTAAFRKIATELLTHANKMAPKVGATHIVFAPSNDARMKLYKRGLKKLGVKYYVNKTNILMKLPEQRVLDNLHPQTYESAVWHVSPSEWEAEPGFPQGRPRLEYVGTGEGGALYGWGWYSAENTGTRDSYIHTFSSNEREGWDQTYRLPNGGKGIWSAIHDVFPDKTATATMEWLSTDGVTDDNVAAFKKEVEIELGAVQEIIEYHDYDYVVRSSPEFGDSKRYFHSKAGAEKYWATIAAKHPPGYRVKQWEGAQANNNFGDLEYYKQIESGFNWILAQPWEVMPLDNEYANVYHLDVPDEAVARMLVWEDPISQQPPRVQHMITRHWGTIAGEPWSDARDFWTGEQVYKRLTERSRSKKRASEFMREWGIVGNKYLDAGSRRGGDATYNYVIWDQSILDSLPQLRNPAKVNYENLSELDSSVLEPYVSPEVVDESDLVERMRAELAGVPANQKILVATREILDALTDTMNDQSLGMEGNQLAGETIGEIDRILDENRPDAIIRGRGEIADMLDELLEVADLDIDGEMVRALRDELRTPVITNQQPLELESSEPTDLDEARKKRELQKFFNKMREDVGKRAREFAAEVAAAGHKYKAGDLVILASGRRGEILGRTMVPDYREPLPPIKEYKARRAAVKARPKVAGYRIKYGKPGEEHISDLPEYGILEPFTGPRELESSFGDLIEPGRKWLWKDETAPDEANHLGVLQRFLVNYYDDTWTMQSKNEAVWDRYDLSKSRRSAMIDEINRNFMDPMKDLVRATGLTLKEVDDWLAARHIVEDNVNRNLAERSALHYVNMLINGKNLTKPVRLELQQRKQEIQKQDVSDKKIREQMYALMNEFAEYERDSFDQRAGHMRQAVKEEWEDFKRHASGMYDPRSGLDNRGNAANAAEIYNRYRDNKKVQAVAELYDKMTTEQLNILREGGTITDEEYTALLEENPMYTPLRRESFDYETHFSFLNEHGSGPAKGVAVRGGSADVDHPIHIMQNTFARLHLAAGHAQRNLANNFLYEQIMADRKNWTGWFTVNEDNTRDRHNPNGFVIEGGTAALANTDIIVLRDGKRLIIKPVGHNERARVFAAAANRLGHQEVSGIFKVFGWVNSIVRFTAVSASPSFLLANMIRDPLTAMYNMNATEAERYTKEIRGNYKKAFGALIDVYVKGNRDPNSAAVQMVERFEKAGGKISFIQSMKEMDNSWNSFEKSMWAEGTPGVKQVVNLFQQIENTNIAIENVMRLATFDIMADQVGEEKAARIAKDLTTNFDRRGFKSSAMGLLYLFFNATIQGNAQVIRNLSKSKKLQHMVGGTLVMAILFDLMGRALSDDDEYGNSEWDKLTGKDRNIILPIPINGVYIRIPAPWVYNTVWRFGGMLSETAAGTRSAVDTASETAAMVLTTFNPMGGGTLAQALTPTALDPVMQVIENRDFAGNQLRPTNFPGAGSKPDSELAWQSTPEKYKWLARTMNDLTGGDVAHSGWVDVAPSTIQNTVNFLGGGLFRFGENVLGMPADALRGELELKNVPIIRQLTTTPSTSIDTQKYYDKVAQVYAAEKAVKAYGEGATLDKEKQAQAKREFAKELRLVNHVKDVERQLKSLRQRRRAAQGRGDKKQVEALTDKINSVQRRFLMTFENRMK